MNIEELKDFLETKKNATTLDLKDVVIGTEGALRVAKWLESHNTLQHLNLTANNIGTKGIEAIASALKNSTSLLTLNISKNYITPQGAKAIAMVLENNSSLVKLDLEVNAIGSEGALRVAKGLESNNTLQHLNLTENNIGTKGIEAIASALKNSTSLLALNISKNYITPQGAKAIAMALENNSSLVKLDLEVNAIGSEGAIAISSALKNNTSLVILNLLQNGIGPEGAIAIVSANSILYNLNLTGRYTDQEVECIIEKLENNHTMLDFRIYYDKVTIQDIQISSKRVELEERLDSYIDNNYYIHDKIFKQFYPILGYPLTKSLDFTIEELKLFKGKKYLYKANSETETNEAVLKGNSMFSDGQLGVINKYINHNFFRLAGIFKQMLIKDTNECLLPKEVLPIISSYLTINDINYDTLKTLKRDREEDGNTPPYKKQKLDNEEELLNNLEGSTNTLMQTELTGNGIDNMDNVE